ncbi:myo-inositol 2-dehydrogenase / D-chiro-inositol 1-dehydrogenase [Evansella caseinilytica]|uniref:Myo-inositol 2-dehydrogenase / D-chiro-inositol 1-dehydrogenase n=1 Tax=Evansella caseinilytica TaxID=1503961 RepID=A0A1H3SUY8_9BACI|nr:inositol 2-dehydrogenase [Evansella caseinilytica]SDZ41792.1 myo-inositol 2-dehydrogenase / D-chiro-inositol 1-dehydrogenase [Evansella caseinilytica]
MAKVKIGMIGAGRIGQLHAKNIIQSDMMELKGIADVYTDHLQGTELEKRAGYITNDPEEILKDKEIEAIFICTSTDTHVHYIEECARHGKHIFCEKPISFKIEETKSVLEAVKQAGVKFQVGFNRRYDKHFRQVKQLVEQGELGELHVIKITSRDPGTPPETYVKRSGGMFMDMTIHDFDMIRYLAGSEVKDITAKAGNLVDPMFEKYGDVDTAIITVTFENGTLGVIDNSRQAVYGYDQRIEVFGSEGSALAENELETNVVVAKRDFVRCAQPKHFFLDRYQDAFVDEINEFATAILTDCAFTCTGEDGWKAEQMAKAAKISYEENRTVRIEEIV